MMETKGEKERTTVEQLGTEMIRKAQRLDVLLSRYRMLCAAVVSLLLVLGLTVYNIENGPLGNLNDIGGWGNRRLFLLLMAFVHMALLLLCAGLTKQRFSRTALRLLLVTAGVFILQYGMNLKSYRYTNVLLPALRMAEQNGVTAGLEIASTMTAPMLSLLYGMTRTPVYALYMIKLLSMTSMLLLVLLAMRWMDNRQMGLKTETVMVLSMILPQGFMNAGCTGDPQTAAVALTGLSLMLLYGELGKKRETAAMVCFGVAAALSGAALYMLPVIAYAVYTDRVKAVKTGWAAAALLVLLAVPCVMGVTPAAAAKSLLRAEFAQPAYAGGAPHLNNLVARAAIEEIPQYSMLSVLPEVDLVTNRHEYYLPADARMMNTGLTLAGLALYMAICAWVFTRKEQTICRRMMLLTAGALLVCPGAESGTWLVLDVLCVMAAVCERPLRVPAAMLLAATAAGACYPMTQETLVPMAILTGVCITAVAMLAGWFDGIREEAKAVER